VGLKSSLKAEKPDGDHAGLSGLREGLGAREPASAALTRQTTVRSIMFGDTAVTHSESLPAKFRLVLILLMIFVG
jgi:hypothetical protein